MELYFDPENMRVFCRWREPVTVVYNKQAFDYHKVKHISMRLNKSGRMNSNDRKRLMKHDKYPAIKSFISLLKNQGVLQEQAQSLAWPGQGPTDRPVAVLRPEEQTVAWKRRHSVLEH